MKMQKFQNKNIPNNEDVFIHPLSQIKVSPIDNHFNDSIPNLFVKPLKILNCKINSLSSEQILDKISDFLQSKNPHRIITVNAEYILEAQKDNEFQEIINNSDLSIPDGIGIIWAAKFLSLPASRHKILRFPQVMVQYVYTGASLVFWSSYCKTVIPERISGVDLIEKIKNQKSKIKNLRIFLLGGFDGAGKKIQEIDPDIIVGIFEGSSDVEDDEEARRIINQAQPNILFVAYGNPASKQEKWISRNLPHLPSVRFAMGAGGSFDFLSGQIKRAPKLMQNLGIEWLWRVIRQPGRIGRIWNAVVVFSFKILIYKVETNLPSFGRSPLLQEEGIKGRCSRGGSS